jgi:hypothetical protein
MTRLDTGPPTRKKRTRKLGGNRDRKTIKKLVRRRPYSERLLSASFRYVSLLAHRYAHGLLTPFICSSCGGMALDPCGQNEKHQHLCEPCADGGWE